MDRTICALQRDCSGENFPAITATTAFFAGINDQSREIFSQRGPTQTGKSRANPLKSIDRAFMAPALQAGMKHH
jgi:hypothetical protein